MNHATIIEVTFMVCATVVLSVSLWQGIKTDASWCVGALFLIGALIGVLLMLGLSDKINNNEAVRHNAGYYGPKTGDFYWNDEKEKP